MYIAGYSDILLSAASGASISNIINKIDNIIANIKTINHVVIITIDITVIAIRKDNSKFGISGIAAIIDEKSMTSIDGTVTVTNDSILFKISDDWVAIYPIKIGVVSIAMIVLKIRNTTSEISILLSSKIYTFKIKINITVSNIEYARECEYSFNFKRIW